MDLLFNFLVTRFIEEMFVFLFTLFFFSLPLIFTLAAASVSHFLTAAIYVFLPTKLVSVVSNSNQLIQVNVDI